MQVAEADAPARVQGPPRPLSQRRHRGHGGWPLEERRQQRPEEAERGRRQALARLAPAALGGAAAGAAAAGGGARGRGAESQKLAGEQQDLRRGVGALPELAAAGVPPQVLPLDEAGEELGRSCRDSTRVTRGRADRAGRAGGAGRVGREAGEELLYVARDPLLREALPRRGVGLRLRGRGLRGRGAPAARGGDGLGSDRCHPLPAADAVAGRPLFPAPGSAEGGGQRGRGRLSILTRLGSFFTACRKEIALSLPLTACDEEATTRFPSQLTSPCRL